MSGATVHDAIAAEFDAPTGTTFNSWALSANGLSCLGPSCTATIGSTTPGGSVVVYDGTATTGATTLSVRAGAGQSTTNLLTVTNNSGSAEFAVDSGYNLNLLANQHITFHSPSNDTVGTVTISAGTSMTHMFSPRLHICSCVRRDPANRSGRTVVCVHAAGQHDCEYQRRDDDDL
ncbi:MAG TPA: hypothetical protein VN924_32795 [Bryobacteraceae bacterium]|nr:hypothetical protein [Bryobacteraceae bacterium]